jgi:hypothetical protein
MATRSQAVFLLALLAAACDSADMVQRGRWQYTCGDTVCHGYQPTPGVAACTGQQSGEGCPVLDERCDPRDDCNRLLLCETDPPPPNPCPLKAAGDLGPGE